MRTIPLLIGVIAIIFLSIAGNATAASAGVVNVSAAFYHSVVLTSDGTVYTWGGTDTSWGILGTGADQSDGSLRRVNGLPAIRAIDANFLTSLAVDRDGRVWAWGDNQYGQCGDKLYSSYSSPKRIDGLEHIVQVSNGGLHCVAVDDSGHVWAWGDNLYGQLGLGNTGPSEYTPVKVPLDNVKMVSAGNGFTVALKNDGTVWAWGENTFGMTGQSWTGIGSKTLTPSKVEGLGNIVKIDVGYDHTLALRDDGTVWAWGDGEENKLCNGQGYYGTATVSVPVQINGLPQIADIAAADHSSMALSRDGSVYVWGSNGDGQYGNGIDLWTPAQSPQKVPGLDNVVSMAAGLGHCVAIKKDGSVWAWGKNDEGQVQPGKGKKVMTPLKKIDGSATLTDLPVPTGQTQTPTATAGASQGTDMTFIITAAGVIVLALAIIGSIILLRMRK